MSAKPPIDHKGGLINSPEAYLTNCTGHNFRRVGGFDTKGGFTLLQKEYENRDGKPYPNCTPTALVNALGFYRGRWPQIPEEPKEIYQLLRGHIRLLRTSFPGIGGYPAFLNTVLVRRLWRLLGIDAWPCTYPFPSAKTLRELLNREKTPLVLSIWSKAYLGHSVVLLGWELWSDGQTNRLFWRVQDGWQRAPRYLDANAVSIWQAILMAK